MCGQKLHQVNNKTVVSFMQTRGVGEGCSTFHHTLTHFTHIHTHSHTSHTHTYIFHTPHPPTHTNIHTHTYTHTHTNKHTHTHTPTHQHTHSTQLVKDVHPKVLSVPHAPPQRPTFLLRTTESRGGRQSVICYSCSALPLPALHTKPLS